MRFGGHQTFYLREGWLYKGLHLLMNEPERFDEDLVFDHLGVGKNMAISIIYWMEAMELAEKTRMNEDSRNKNLKPTPLGHLIYKKDKYFTQEETWWILHINLLSNRDSAESWYWFFNHLGTDRFLREQGLRRFSKYMEEDLHCRKPTPKTLERDFSCLLNTYAAQLPISNDDPEEDIWCPLRDLDLLISYKSTNHYALQRRRRSIGSMLLMYALEKCFIQADNEEEYEPDKIQDIRFFDLTRLPNNPQRVFLLHTDGFYELLGQASEALGPDYLSIMGLAGERQIRVARNEPLSYVKSLYSTEAAMNA